MIKRKLMVIIAVCLLIFSLAACGEDPRTVDYNGYTYDQIQQVCQSTVLSLEELSPSQLQQYIDNASASPESAALAENWIKNRTDLGDFIDFGDFEITKAGKTLTAAQTVLYEERPLILTYVFNYNTMEVTDIGVDLVYTTGEKMSKAGLNTVMCISIVFIVLIIIMLVIAAFKLINMAQSAAEAKETEPAPRKDTFVEQIKERESVTDGGELIAVITAAIAAASAGSGGSSDFVVRSIRRR